MVDADERWTLYELNQAEQRTEEIFGHAVKMHGAAGWQVKVAAYLWKARMGLQYASYTRGQYQFQPVVNDAVLSFIQMRTNLPTLDELLSLNDTTPVNVHEGLLQAKQDYQRIGNTLPYMQNLKA
jgi:undecaprenyl phosphate-alpha-L-ara4FN deformylase